MALGLPASLLPFSFYLAKALVWVIGPLVLGAYLEFGAWNFALPSYLLYLDSGTK
jgi:hypothetical protein